MRKFQIALFGAFFLLSFTSMAPQTEAQTISTERILELVNNERVNAGLGRVTFEKRLNEAAGIKARDMAAKTYFDHVSPDGVDPWDLLVRVGYDWAWAGENLALNAQTLSEEAIVKAWMDSPSHRAIILTESHTETGIGLATGIYNGQSVVYVSQFFASPKVTPSEVVKEAPAPKVISNNQSNKTEQQAKNFVMEKSKAEIVSATATSSAVEEKPINKIEKKSWRIKLNIFVKKLLAVFVKTTQAFNR